MVDAVIPGYYYAFEIIVCYSENDRSHRLYYTNTLYYCLRDEKKTTYWTHLTTISLWTPSLSLSLKHNSKIKPIQKTGSYTLYNP